MSNRPIMEVASSRFQWAITLRCSIMYSSRNATLSVISWLKPINNSNFQKLSECIGTKAKLLGWWNISSECHQTPWKLLKTLPKIHWPHWWHQPVHVTSLLLTLEIHPSPVIGDTKKENITELPPQDCLPSSNPNMWVTLLAWCNWDPMLGSHTNPWVQLCTYVKPLVIDPSMPRSQTDLSLYLSTNNPPKPQRHHGQSSPKSHYTIPLAIDDALWSEVRQ